MVDTQLIFDNLPPNQELRTTLNESIATLIRDDLNNPNGVLRTNLHSQNMTLTSVQTVQSPPPDGGTIAPGEAASSCINDIHAKHVVDPCITSTSIATFCIMRCIHGSHIASSVPSHLVSRVVSKVQGVIAYLWSPPTFGGRRAIRKYEIREYEIKGARLTRPHPLARANNQSWLQFSRHAPCMQGRHLRGAGGPSPPRKKLK